MEIQLLFKLLVSSYIMAVQRMDSLEQWLRCSWQTCCAIHQRTKVRIQPLTIIHCY